MKKLLIGTTALVAAGFIAGEAAAADKIAIKVGGYMDNFVGFGDNDDDYDKNVNTAGGANNTGFDVQQDSEIFFSGSTKLDNGMTVGVKVEMEVGQATDTTTTHDEYFAYISSDAMGKIYLGAEDSATSLAHNKTGTAGANFGLELGDMESWVARPGAVTRNRTTMAEEATDYVRIGYMSPSFSGFTINASYAPDASQTAAGASSTADSTWDAGVAYSGKFGDVSVKADIFHVAQNGGESAGTAPQGWDATGGGLKVGFGAFTVAGAYKSIDQSKSGTSSMDGDVWSIGAEYKSGPMAVGLGWLRSELEGTVATSDDDQMDWITLNASYDMGGGVKLAGTIAKAEYDDETTTKANNNEGWAAVGALQVSF